MSVVETVNRNYSMGDLEMLERAQVFHDSYVIDNALFTAAFTKFGLTYAADFQTAIDAALDMPEPIFIQIYDGPDRHVVYNSGGPDNYLFKVRAKTTGPTFCPWSDVLIVVR